MSSLRSGAFNLLKTSRLIGSHQASISRSALVQSDMLVRDKLKEAKQETVTRDEEKSLSALITVEGAPDVTVTSGMPEEERLTRVVRIYKPAKNAMQSGTAGIKRCDSLLFTLNRFY